MDKKKKNLFKKIKAAPIFGSKIGMAVAIIIIALFSCSQAEDKLVLGLIAPSTDWLPVAVALEEGFIDKDNLQIHYFSSGWEVNEAIIAGRIDIAIMPFTYAWKGVSEEKDVRIISFFERESDGIIAAPGIESLEQLDGRRIGVLRASTLDIFVNMIMDKYDFEPEIVYFRSPTEMAPSLQEGYVDALSFYVPVIFNIGEPYEIIYWFGETYPGHPCCDIVATKSAIDIKRDIISEFMEVMRISSDYIKQNPEKAIEIMMKTYRLSSQAAQSTLQYTGFTVSFDEVGKEFQEETAAKMKELGYIKRIPLAEEVYYHGFQ